jgi:fatty acid desaturase
LKVEDEIPMGSRRTRRGAQEEALMLLTIGIVLLVLWALGLFAFHVTTGFIHVLIVLALIAVLVHFLRGDRLAT